MSAAPYSALNPGSVVRHVSELSNATRKSANPAHDVSATVLPTTSNVPSASCRVATTVAKPTPGPRCRRGDPVVSTTITLFGTPPSAAELLCNVMFFRSPSKCGKAPRLLATPVTSVRVALPSTFTRLTARALGDHTTNRPAGRTRTIVESAG